MPLKMETIKDKINILLDEQEFIEDLVYARCYHGLTQSQLATLSGLTIGQVSRIERGCHRPRLHTILRYIAGLNCRLTIADRWEDE